MRRALFAAALAACGGNSSVVVTIDTQPAVRNIATLQVTLMNNGTTRGQTFTVDGQTFPATFSVSGGDSGDLLIDVAATDANEIPVGHGVATASFDDDTATVVLDSADFVVNTDFADDQFPSNDFESHGFQVGSGPDGTWTAVFRDGCASPCNEFARRFDVTGLPVESGLAAGTNSFAVSTELGDGFFTTPTTATSGNTTVALWNFQEPSPSTVTGVACRAMDAQGNGLGDQSNVVTETSFPFAVAVTPLPNGKYAVTWNSTANQDIRSAILSNGCTTSAMLTVSTITGSGGAIRASVTSSNDRVLYGWVLDGDAHIRVASSINTPISNDFAAVGKSATDQVRFVRVAPLGDGFALAIRTQAIDGMGPGSIQVFAVNNNGVLMGKPTVVTIKSGSDFESAQGFSIATRAEDGAMMVVWHACGTNGDGSGCGVFGRVLRPSLVPVGDEFSIATTIDNDQTSPSVTGLPGAFAATWRDLSGKAPDKAGSAVRARVLYPPYDDAKRVIGAACTGASECDDGLACGAATDGGKRCFPTCDLGLPLSQQCPAGGTCGAADGGSACLF